MGIGKRLYLVVMAAALLGPLSSSAQTLAVDAAAESVFRSAVDAFENERYPSAAEAFLSVADDYAMHRKTTAAAVMAGKSLYRAGLYRRAAERLLDFERDYPRSSYVAEARETRRLAEEAARNLEQAPVDLGILLALTGEEAPLTQSLFNGLRLAVEEHNASSTGRPARMVFREIGTFPESAGAAMAALGRENVALTVGALFSDQAKAAAAAAERFGMVYVAPLATSDEVSDGRRFVFQANPSLTTRGRMMARFAVNGLLLKDIAVIFSQGDGGVGTTVADAFADELVALGGTVPIRRALPSPREWFRLPTYLQADSLAGVRAIYLPLSGSGANRLAAAALAGLDEVGANVRVLGNAEWHNLPIRSLASRYNTTYSNDYLVDLEDPDTQLFFDAYETRFGVRPGRVAVVGYDVGRMILDALAEGDADLVADRLRSAPLFEGLGMQIDFAGGQINQALFYHRYSAGKTERIR